jgi:hypothetical protein
MQSTGQTLTHPVSMQSMQSLVIVQGIGTNPFYMRLPSFVFLLRFDAEESWAEGAWL